MSLGHGGTKHIIRAVDKEEEEARLGKPESSHHQPQITKHGAMACG